MLYNVLYSSFSVMFQFSKILPTLACNVGNRYYTDLHFKGISFLTAYLAIQVIILFPSNKEFTVKRATYKQWVKLTQEILESARIQ